MDLRSGQRVWVNNGRVKERPGFVLEVFGKSARVLIPSARCQVERRFHHGSIRVMVWADWEAWSDKWDSLVEGRHLFD